MEDGPISSSRETITDEWLEVTLGNSHEKLILFLRSNQLDRSHFFKVVFRGTVRRYFSFFGSTFKVERMQLKSKVLDYLIDTRKTVKNRSIEEGNLIGAKLQPVLSDVQSFEFEGKEVHIQMITAVNGSTKIGSPPLYPSSYLELSFDDTDDYGFIDRLISYSEQVIRFCAYSRQFAFEKTTLRHSALMGKKGNKKKYYTDVGSGLRMQ